jgi:hypothetical protein
MMGRSQMQQVTCPLQRLSIVSVPCSWLSKYHFFGLPIFYWIIDISPNATAAATDIAIQNPTDSDEELPDGSTVVIGVNEIEPLG